jgi:hypothetical protein
MALNPSPQRQSVVTFPTPNVNDILFFETVDAERVGSDVPKYGSSHPDYKKWPNHRLVHVEAADDQRQNRYYRYYYAADQLEQDNDNWSYSEADIGGTKFDAVSRDYVIRRSEFSSTVPAMGATMPDTPTGKFSGTHVLAERKQIPLNDKILNGLYVVEQRVYVKKVPLSRLDFDEFFKTTNETKQTLYYRGETPTGASDEIEDLNSDNAYWGMHSGTIRTVQQLSDNWFAVTEQEVVKCPTSGEDGRLKLQDEASASIASAISGHSASSDRTFFTSITANMSGSNLVGYVAVRNSSCWAHDLTGITGFVARLRRYQSGTGASGNPIVYNDTESDKRGGVLVTPRHVYFSKQSPLSAKDVVFFVDRNNIVYERTVIRVKLHAGNDMGVALLNRDLPKSVEPIKVLPKDSYQFFNPSNFNSNPTPTTWTYGSPEVLIFNTDREKKANIAQLSEVKFQDFNYENPEIEVYAATTSATLEISPPSSTYSSWKESTNLDSGSPVVMVLGGECVLLGTFKGSTSQTSSSVEFLGAPSHFRDANELIKDVDVEYAAVAAADTNIADYFSDSYQLSPIDLSFGYTSYRPEEAAYPVGECARLSYETVVNYAFPPILQDVQFDVWNLRSGGARTYPRVLYSKGSFRGPCKAVVDISWSTTQPVGLEAGEKPAPEPISIQNPLFTLSIPPTLHEAVNFTVSINSDETWNNTGAVYNKNATNVTTWEPHIISSEVKPFRGGWLMETVTVYPPS